MKPLTIDGFDIWHAPAHARTDPTPFEVIICAPAKQVAIKLPVGVPDGSAACLLAESLLPSVEEVAVFSHRYGTHSTFGVVAFYERTPNSRKPIGSGWYAKGVKPEYKSTVRP